MNLDKIEPLQKIADRHRGIHDKRRSYEYKILILTFTLIISATFLTISNKIGTYSNIYWLIALSVIFLSIAVSAYIRRLHRANAKNMTVAENCEIRILDIIEEIKILPGSMRKRELSKEKNNISIDSNWFFQMLILVLTATIAALIIIAHKLTIA